MTKSLNKVQKKRTAGVRPAKRTGPRGATPVRAAPLAVAVTRSPTAPQFTGIVGGTRIHRRELAGAVTNTVSGFQITPLSLSTPGYDISATCGALFPWLSLIAMNWEKYRFTRLRFELISAQPASQQGRVYMMIDPDWDDPVATTKAALMGRQISVDDAVWKTVTLNLPMGVLNSGMPYRYCSPVGNRVAEGEPRTSYAGYLQIAVDSATTGLTWDLWVDYDVELVGPTNEMASRVLVPVTTSTPSGTTMRSDGATGSVLDAIMTPAGSQNPLFAPVATALLNLAVKMYYNNIVHDKYAVDTVYTVPSAKRGQMDCYLPTYGVAATTPAAFMAANSPAPVVQFWDALGNYLGDSTSVNSSLMTFGPMIASAVNTAAAPMMGRISFYLENLFNQYPNAAYWAPIIKFGVANLLSMGLVNTANLKLEL